MNSTISLIAAIGENRELGKDNQLLWHIPEDFKRFKDLTTGHPIIMGRKTFESLNRPDGLPNRLNIIISRNSQPDTEHVKWVPSLDEALKLAQSSDSSEIFIIGGGQIFKEAINISDKLYLSIVHQTFPEADVFFPDYSEFKREVSRVDGESNGFKYTFLDLIKE